MKKPIKIINAEMKTKITHEIRSKNPNLFPKNTNCVSFRLTSTSFSKEKKNLCTPLLKYLRKI